MAEQVVVTRIKVHADSPEEADTLVHHAWTLGADAAHLDASMETLVVLERT